MSRRSIAAVLFLAIAAFGAWQLAGDPGQDSTTVELQNPDQRTQHEAAELLQAGASDRPAEPDTAPTRAVGETKTKIEVRGRLIDTDKEPLAATEVKLRPGKSTPFGLIANRNSTKDERSTKTGADGSFRFVVDPGTPGLVRLAGKEWILSKATRFAASPQDIDLGDLECVKTATLSGRVHSAGRGLPGVQVNVWGHRSGYHNEKTKTDAEGKFTLEGVAPGDCTLMCSSPKHLTKQKNLALEPGEVQNNIDVELAAGTSLSGQVVDDVGRPIAEINVSAHGHYEKTKDGSQFVQGRTKSDEHGFFTLNGLAGKTINVNATGKGYTSYWKNKVPIDGGLLIIQLTRLGAISGVLLSETNEPIAGSTVRATRKGSNGLPNVFNVSFGLDGGSFQGLPFGASGKTAKTDDKGRFTIENIRPGTLNLIATGKHRKAEYNDVLVRPGETTEGITIQAERGVVAEVTVVDPDGEPVADAKVSALVQRQRKSRPGRLQQFRDLQFRFANAATANGQIPRYFSERRGSATTDRDGKASIWGLEAGTYTFRAEHPKWVRSESQPLAVPGHGTMQVDLQTLRGGSIEVTAVETSGKPLASVPVRVTAKAGKQTRNGTTDSTGRVTLGPLAPGTYEVSLPRSRGFGSMSFDGAYLVPALSVGGGRRSLTSSACEVRENQTTKVRLVKPVLTVLSGIVRDSVGPVASAIVQITAIDPKTQKGNPRSSHTATTNSKGEFAIKDLEPGTYHLVYRRRWNAFPVLEQLVIASGVKSQTRNLVISGQSLTVAARSKGLPVEKARVRLLLVPGSQEPKGPGRACNATTNAQGEAVLSDLQPGTYDLKLTCQGYAPKALAGIQLPGKDRIEAELVPAGRIAVTVQGAMAGKTTRFLVNYRVKGTKQWKSAGRRGTKLEIQNLAPGQYEVRAALRVPGSQARNWSAPVLVTVESGRTAPVALPVR